MITPVVNVKVPKTVALTALLKERPATSFNVKLLKVVAPVPFIACPVPALKLTVPLLCVKVAPLVRLQFPLTLKVVDGAVNVPLLNTKLVVFTVPPAPVKVPPLIVRPPLKDCVAAPAR